MIPYHQYKNQANPTRQPVGNVILHEDEYKIFFYGNLATIYIIDYPEYQYTLHYPYDTYAIGSTATLYTTDQDGNPKQPSCFSITII